MINEVTNKGRSEEADWALRRHRAVRLGMPHLADRGLGENWLYRYCGHAHWELLSEFLGSPSSQIVDASGARLYASFVSLRLSGSLAPFRENERVTIESMVQPLSSKRFLSNHQIRGAQGRVGLTMVSTFIKQKTQGDNRAFLSMQPLSQVAGLPGHKLPCPLLDDFKEARSHLDEEPEVEAPFNYLVVPAVDFNGARFLYFANFHAIEDRAFHFFTGHSSFHTIDRTIHFFGNINRTETVQVFLQRRETKLQMETTSMVMRRESDGHPLAFMSTRRFAG